MKHFQPTAEMEKQEELAKRSVTRSRGGYGISFSSCLLLERQEGRENILRNALKKNDEERYLERGGTWSGSVCAEADVMRG